MSDLFLGLITGVIFGFLLQKGRVLRFDKQVGAMRLKDMTIIKFMMSAILVGMVGLYTLRAIGYIELSHKPMNLGGVIIGGLLFGVGWSIMGYCPGTSVGAIGEGRWHAGFAVLGMIIGAAIYAECYPLMLKTVLAWKDFGKVGLPEAIGVSPWILIPLFWVGTIALFRWFERMKI
ncbi:MAG: YeeE/YedE family protein [Candidatus Hydrogenedentes bacterium]|nr:YeeE/YedE family protein [Candidatus Hydrogenedentota bacterium]